MARFQKPADILAGVVGYGSGMGRAHLTQMRDAGMTPLAVAEFREDRRRLAEEHFPGIETYPSAEDMLARSAVNFVALITPHNTHADLALQCLRAGRHVCCEKPLAITTEQCEQMVRAADERGLLLTAYHNRHWDGGILKAKHLIEAEGLIGEVVRVDACIGRYRPPREAWRGSKSASGGILYDWGVHLTEYALQLLDDEMVEVFGWSRRGYWAPRGDRGEDTVEDEALAVVRFRRGGLFALRVTSIDADPPPHVVKVTGTEGTCAFSPHGTYRVVMCRGGETFVAEGKNPDGQWQRLYENVVAHLVHDEALIITPAWAMRPVHVLELADRSAREGTALKTRLT
jgi:predicted dehydrogenase